MDVVKTKREQVKDLIAEGGHTKADIAEALEMSVSSVSSQMTYLRWMGNNIVYNEDKVLSLVTVEEFEAWQATRAARTTEGRAKKASTKSPEEQMAAVTRTLKGAMTALNNWEARIVKTTEDNIEDFEEFTAESSANVVLLEIKIKRAEAKIEELKAMFNPAKDEDVDEDDIETAEQTDMEDEDEELL